MAVAKNGDTVKINYIGKHEGEIIFNSSYDRDEPAEFKLGASNMLPGFEKVVIGMQEGDKKNITITNAFGEYRDDLVVTVQREEFPETIKPNVGMTLQGPSIDGLVINVVVTAFDDKTVTLNGNHILAGKAVDFEIELLQIVPPE